MKQYKGLTFAQASQKIAKKYPDRDTDKSQSNAFQAEIGVLMKAQEQMKAQMQPTQQFAYGGDPTALLPQIQPELASMYATSPMPGIVPPRDSRVTPMLQPQQENPLPSIIPPRNSKPTNQIPTLANKPLETRLDYPNMPEATGPNDYQAKFRGDKTLFSESKVGSYLGDNIYAPVAIGKGLEFAAKAFQLADGYDTVDPELNQNSSRIRQLMNDRRINLDSVRNDMLSGYNNAVEGANPVRSQSVRQAIGQNAANSLTSGMANASLQEQQANNAYRGEEAQTLNNLGQQDVQSRNYAEQLNNQSKAGYQQSLQNMFTSIGNAGQELTNFRAGIAQQQLVADTLKTANFEFGNVKNILRTAARNGELEIDDIIKIIDFGNAGGTQKATEEYTQELMAYRKSLKS